MTWPWRISSQLRAISATLARIETKVNQVSAEQDTLNAIATQIENDITGENAALDSLKTSVAALEAAAQGGQPLDFTAVNQAVADLGSTLGNIQQVATDAAAATAPQAPPPTSP